MSHLTYRNPLTPEDRDTFLELLSQGKSVRHACKAIGQGYQTMYRRRSGDEKRGVEPDHELAEAWAEAARIGHDVKCDRTDEEIEERMFDRSDPASWRLLMLWVSRRHPAYQERQQIELSTPAGPLQIEDGRRATSIADVIELARAVGAGLGEGLRASASGGGLPAAGHVLPDPAASERSADALPPG